MKEYIEREAAIREFTTCGALFVHDESGCKAIISRLLQIPAADVQPVVRGRWDDKTVAFFFKCSECGCCVGHRHDLFLDRGKLNYCPNCGADMRGES